MSYAHTLPADLEAAIQRLEEIEAAESSLYEFVKRAWHVIDPGHPFVDNWHLRVICDKLEAVTRREIRRLIINVPPRSGKSSIVCVLWPVWTWLQDPTHQWLTISHSGTFATRDALKSRRLIQSPWFQSRWGDRFNLTGDQNQKTRYENDKRGYRIALGITGGITGEGGDTILLDDPMDRDAAHSELERERANVTYDEAISTRLNDPATGAIVVIMQRLHEQDTTGHLLAGDEHWEHLCLPMLYEADHPFRCDDDTRTEEGEPLWPERYTDSVVARLKARLGAYGFAGQMLQRPSPLGGGIWKPETHIQPARIESGVAHVGNRSFRLDQLHRFNVCDMAYSATKMADWTSIIHFAGDTATGTLIIERVTRFRVDVLGTAEAAEHRHYIKQARERTRAAYTIVEDGFFASRIIERMQQEGEPVRSVKADKNKVARAMAALPVAENGNLYADKDAEWWQALSDELKRFRGGDEKNDQADCVAYGCLHWRDVLVPADPWSAAIFQAAGWG